MPINELEQHPCLDYLQQEGIQPLNDYQGLIVGTFPSYGCTDTVDDDMDIVDSRIDVPNFRMKFFYSNSPTSYKFWEYLGRCYNLPNPIEDIVGTTEPGTIALLNKTRCITFLQSQKLLITDTIWRTNRQEIFDESGKKKGEKLLVSEGVDPNIVGNFSLNRSLNDLLFYNDTISNIYFTSSGDEALDPFSLFKQIFNNRVFLLKEYNINGKVWGLECLVNEKYYKIFFIPSFRTVSRKNVFFRNYLKRTDSIFYNEIIDLKREEMDENQKDKLSDFYNQFRIEAYQQAFVRKNLKYNGSNPI